MINVVLVGVGEWIEWAFFDDVLFVIFLKDNKDLLRYSFWNGRKR